jgi:lipopolysaccharide assembly outer membrane protein LptD (OstA)
LNPDIALPTKLRTGKALKTLLILLTFIAGMQVTMAQNIVVPTSPDTLIKHTDSIADTTKTGKSKSAINAKVDYKSADSIAFNMREQKVYLYNKAEIAYEDIGLKADRIEIDFKRNIISAKGVNDTTGKETGTPEFKQASETFRSKTINYNYKSRKGLIYSVITKEGEGYIHGTTVKKLTNGELDIRNGSYTTCSLDEPHFEIKFTKAKVIPGNKIITGPAYMSIEGVPLPIGLPFGMFPNKKGQSSGLVIPTYGESTTRGFYLENGGYYWGISDHMDLKLVGDIYSRGSWAAKPTFNYRKRYRYNGSFNFSYAINIDGEKETPQYARNSDFRVTWSHRQDPKARPNSVFSASVNAGSSKFDRYNPATMANHLSNQLSSQVSYDVTLGPNYHLSASASHSQNTSTHTVNITLPEIAFSVNQFYPFRSKTSMGRRKWYEDISVKYNMNAKNELDTYDSLLFRPKS